MNTSEWKGMVKSVLKWMLNTSAPLFSRVTNIDSDTARKTLSDYAPRHEATAFAENRLLTPKCDLQVVIPAYNVEAYLAQCMDSILSQQTKYTFHVILVDDGSTDGTAAIADRYASDSRVTVIHQKNQGPGSRNTGIRTIFGKYLMFVDSDDILFPGALEQMLDTAYHFNSDLVEAGGCYIYDSHQTVLYRHDTSRPVTSPYDTLHGYPWAKLYRAELFRDLCFPEGYWYEDSIVSFLLFPRAQNPCVCSAIAYGYRVNESGIVHSSHGKPKAVDTFWITQMLVEAHAAAGLPADDSYFRYLLQQIRLNQHRISELPEKIRESVFVLTCELFSTTFPGSMTDPKNKNLIRALRQRDFGMYQMCCKLL